MPPIAKRKKHVLTIGDNTKTDYYYWLRDDKREDKQVIKYLDEENAYTDEQMMKRGILLEKNRILKKLKGNLVENWETVRLPKGKNGFTCGYLFYKKYVKGCAHPIYMYEKDGEEKEYCNPNNLVKKGKMLSVTTPVFNEDLSVVGWGVDYNGSEKYALQLFSFPDLEKIDHDLPELLYADFLLVGNKIFYALEDDANRLNRINVYTIGGDVEQLYMIDDNRKSVFMDLSDDWNYFFYGWRTSDENEYNMYNLLSGEKKLVKKAKRNVIYSVNIYNGTVVLEGNFDKKGVNFYYNDEKLLEEDELLHVDEWGIVKDGLIILCRKDGEQFLRFIDLENGGKNDWKEFTGGFSLDIVYTSYRSNHIVISYEDLITPEVIWKVKVGNWQREFMYEEKTIGYKKDLYKVRRKWVDSGNVKVPVDIISKEGNKKVLLYGYGCYGVNIDCTFDWRTFVLINEGYDYALAHVRGSSYMGEKWYKTGKMKKKMNSFYDFNNAAKYLNEIGYEVSCEGRSAGGLLVAASSVMQPQLYKNVLAIVPFVDVITTMSDETIPLTTGEWLEIGNPNMRTYWNYMRKYSPVDNVKTGVCYPNYYVSGGLYDPRVAYWEPAKFVAVLRHHADKKCENVVYLRMEMGGGHFVANDRYRMLEQYAERYAFLVKN